MQHFLIRRGLYVILMLVLVSIVGFVVINLPPGDFMDAYLARMQSSGTEVDRETADNLRRNYGLDKPLYVQYLIWFFGVVRGDFGWSFDHQIPVSDLVKERIALTLVISLCTMIFVYAAAIPIRHRQRRAAVLADRLHGDPVRLRRSGHAQLPACAAADVLRVSDLRRRRRRPGSPTSTSTRPGRCPRCWTCCSTCGCR